MHSTDDDVGCCMDNVRPAELVPAACTSLRCLAHDLHAAPDLPAAKAAVLKHDRHLYLLAALVAAALLWALLVRSPSPIYTRSAAGRGGLHEWAQFTTDR